MKVARMWDEDVTTIAVLTVMSDSAPLCRMPGPKSAGVRGLREDAFRLANLIAIWCLCGC